MEGHENIVKATHAGKLKITEDVILPCFVLENKTRVISGRGMTTAIGMKGRGQGVQRITTHKTLAPFITPDLLAAIENPIKFYGIWGTRLTYGYEATILLQICEAILSARDAGVLKTEQELRYAQQCDILIRAFAKVGIIALVDEATGYQAERDRDELHRILEAYISAELLPWTKRFPDEFYKELFRLRGWQYNPLSVARPGYVGKLTNKLVYEKLPEGVLEELKARNPKNPKGNRRYRHHQFLTEDIGNIHLEKHLAAVTTLMRISSTWIEFVYHFNKAFHIDVEQEGINFPEEETEE